MRVVNILILLILVPGLCFAHCLSDAQRDYLYGNYEEAIKKAKDLRASDESLYFLGIAHMKTGDYQKARSYLRKLISRFPNSGLWAQGAAKLADSYFLEGNYLKAGRLYEDIMEEGSSSDIMSLVYLRLAQIAGKKGDWKEKNKYLELIKKKYPQSPQIHFVDTLESYGDFFTVQVGAFSVKRNALSLFNELEKDYKPYIEEEAKNGYPIYKVRVGRFKKKYQADKVCLNLRDKGYPARIYP